MFNLSEMVLIIIKKLYLMDFSFIHCLINKIMKYLYAMMFYLGLSGAFAVAFAQTMPPPPPPPAPPAMPWAEMQTHFKVFDGEGKPLTFSDMMAQLVTAQVIFLGEQHDDPVGHAVEFAVLQEVYRLESLANPRVKRSVALSMEMFERDTQTVVNEYLKGTIREKDLLGASRPWNNYASDYKPLIEFAKEKQLAFIAGNAPGRYVSVVGRGGIPALQALSPQAKKWVAPLPYHVSSSAYASKFNKLMGDMGGHGNSFMLDAQTLRDATMAYSIAEYLKTNPKSVVVHANGTFHSESTMGVPEHLARYAPRTKVKVLTMVSDASYPNFDTEKHTKLGDFVIVGDPALPRTFKSGF